MIDKWEEQIARGETPDLLEAFDEESISHMARLRQAAKDRDPYGLSMKATFDKIQTEATREGLHIGKPPTGMTPEKEKLLQELFNAPTFGGDPND